MSAAPRTPAESFATLLAWLGRAVVARGGGGQLGQPLIALIIDRLRGINQCFARLAARIRDGRYARRTVAPHRRAAAPRRPYPLPQTFGWLLPLLPEAPAYRSQLEHLLRDAEMAALLQAAPEALGRPLRSLCRMLGLRPPPIVAPIAAPLRAGKTPHTARTAEPEAPPPAHPPLRSASRPTAALARASPKPA